jgi:hypothetical protein
LIGNGLEITLLQPLAKFKPITLAKVLLEIMIVAPYLPSTPLRPSSIPTLLIGLLPRSLGQSMDRPSVPSRLQIPTRELVNIRSHHLDCILVYGTQEILMSMLVRPIGLEGTLT